jgi:hypothetical protein
MDLSALVAVLADTTFCWHFHVKDAAFAPLARPAAWPIVTGM